MSIKIHRTHFAKVLLPPQCTCLILLAIMGLPTIGVGDAVASASKQQSLTATLTYTFRPTQQVVARGNVFLSKHGLRVEGAEGTASFGEKAITNNEMQKYWLIDEQREMVHEVPLTILDDTVDITAIVLGLSESIDNAPCIGAHGTLLGHIDYKGRSLESWQCSIDLAKAHEDDELHLPKKQYFSPELGLVMYSLNHDQIEIELVDIVLDDVDPALFLPAKHLRPVSIEEYSGLPSVLESYGYSEQ